MTQLSLQTTRLVTARIDHRVATASRATDRFRQRLVLAVVVLLAAALTIRPAGAQTVRGVVRGMAPRTGIAGVTVSLLDARDTLVTSVVTNKDGSFSLVAPEPGTYSLALRAIGYEPMLTTPFALGLKDQVNITLEMIRTAISLDTVVVQGRDLFTLTTGRSQFLEHYRDGRGMYLSGFEIAVSKKGIAEYVSTLPGFGDARAGNAASRTSSACQTLNDELRGIAPSMASANRAGNAEFGRRDDLCALRDEAGRVVYPTTAPCVTSQVDRMGFVKRVEGTDLVVHRHMKLFTPSAGFTFSDADTSMALEMTVHLKDVIAVEFYQKPGDIPKNLRIRGATPEAEFMVRECAHIQFWTRTAW